MPATSDARRRLPDGAALALGLGTPAAGAIAATTMGVAASVHTPNGFFATKGGFEYPAVLGVAAAAFALAGPGPVSLDRATHHVFDKPWMRAVALLAIPITVLFEVRRRNGILAADSAAAETPVAEGSTDPA